MDFNQAQFLKMLEYLNRIHDITLWKQLSSEERLKMIHDLCDIILEHEK